MSNLDFMNKFKPETRCIKEFKYWIVCIIFQNLITMVNDLKNHYLIL